MNGPQHYAEAERLIQKGLAKDSLTAAQVHATLALAAATICAGNQRTNIGDDHATYTQVAQGDDWAEAIK